MTHTQGLTTEGLATENKMTNNLDAALAPALISDDPTQTVTTAATGNAARPLSMHIKNMLEDYFRELDGHPPVDLYQMVLAEVEQPLLESVLRYTRGNQSKAAAMLGLNRGTLRKKLKQYDLN